MEGDRGGSSGEKGVEGVQETEVEGVGSRIPKEAESTRYFAIEKAQRGGSQQKRAGTGLKGTGSRKFNLLPHPPLPNDCTLCRTSGPLT